MNASARPVTTTDVLHFGFGMRGPWLIFALRCDIGRFVGRGLLIALALLSLGCRPEPPLTEDVPPGISLLRGPWYYRIGDNPTWASPSFDDVGWRSVALPVAADDLDAGVGAVDVLEVEGVVWLRRRMGLPARDALEPQGWLVTPPPLGAYRLFAGGEEIARFARQVPSMPTPPARVFRLPPGAVDSEGVVQLAIRYEPAAGLPMRMVARDGSIGDDFLIGRYDAVAAEAERRRLRGLRGAVTSVVLMVTFLLIGAYHLYLFGRRRRYVEYLWFGLMSSLFALVTLVSTPWAHELGVDLSLLARLGACLNHLLVVAGVQFLWPFLKRPIEPWLRGYQVSHLVLAALALVVPLSWLAASHGARWLWFLPALVGATMLLAQESWRGSREARTIAIGVLLLVATVLAEMVRQVWLGATAAPLPFWAFAVFAVSMTASLAERFTRLHAELDQLRLHLERMVGDRTEELTSANRQLQNEIAERHLAEGAMRMLERAVEQSRDGIAITNPEGKTQFINQSWAGMHGYEVLNVLGQHLSFFFTSEQLHEQLMPFMRQVEEQGAHEGEVEHRHRDGALFPTWMSVTLLRDPDQRPAGFVAFARDIRHRRAQATERIELESKVQRAKRLESLASLAGGIGHDYNNLLTVVLSNAALALRATPHESPAVEKLRQIEGAAERARDLTTQLLAYAGEEAATQTLQLNEVIRQMEPTLSADIDAYAALELQLKKVLPEVAVDQDQIRQMILNLVDNAVESLATERGFITLRTATMQAEQAYLDDSVVDGEHPPGRYVFLEVSDSGMGMDEETKAKMFEPLFTTKSSGRGMGLAAVEGIVRAHNGTIKVFSEPGRGTTVQVLFPPAPERADFAETSAEESGNLLRWRAEGVVMVVDDEEILRQVAQAILEDHGFTVVTAGDGPIAISTYRDQQDAIRLVLLDWTMPDMDGEQVFREIRRMSPQARVILMSGYQEQTVMNDLGGLGLAGFLQKPFKPDELISKVHEVLTG